jgi:hypothetical protein
MDLNPYESPKTAPTSHLIPRQDEILTGLIISLVLSFATLGLCWWYLSCT